MNFLQFSFTFIALLLFGTLTVTGWFFVTRGTIVVMPDNTVAKKGKLFRDFFFYFTRKKRLKTFSHFSGAQLKKLLLQVQADLLHAAVHNQHLAPYLEVQDQCYLHFANAVSVRGNILRQVEDKYDIKFQYCGYNAYRVTRFYDDYVFPEWVRNPVAVCVTCFSSIYGSLFYWLVVPFLTAPFAWSTYPVFHLFFFWITFCLSLAVLNTALAKKYN